MDISDTILFPVKNIFYCRLRYIYQKAFHGWGNKVLFHVENHLIMLQCKIFHTVVQRRTILHLNIQPVLVIQEGCCSCWAYNANSMFEHIQDIATCTNIKDLGVEFQKFKKMTKIATSIGTYFMDVNNIKIDFGRIILTINHPKIVSSYEFMLCT